MNQEISRLIDSYREEYIRTLQEWVRIPSVQSEPTEGAPFGPDVARMMKAGMKTAADMGFAVRDFDGYAFDATLGDQPESVGVLGHLDVVPVGEGWTREPFGAEIENGRIYGRGSSDDKGPSLAALFAMKALKEAGVPLRRSIRLIMGGDEEQRWESVRYYAAHAEMPKIGFSPDAMFPVINTEKGMIRMELHFPAAENGLRILEMKAGERPNVIAGECRALVEGGAELAEKTAEYARETGLDYRAEITERGVLLTAVGIQGHSAYPEGRRSAIGMMILLLKKLGAEGGIAELADAVGLETDGRSLGCACEDEVSGPLTNNLGILHLENGRWHATMDFRTPVCADPEKIRAACAERMPGIETEIGAFTPPHHVPAESELVTALVAAYEEETGLDGTPQFTGGGTFGRVMEQGVAYGAVFPEEDDVAHQPDEYASLDSLTASIRIYANALMRLAAE